MPKLAKPNIHYQFNLELQDRSYPIIIGEHLLTAELIQPYIVADQVLIISDATVAHYYLAEVEAACFGAQVNHVLITEGEEHKTLASIEVIINALVEGQHRRSTTIIALGGGLIGDMSGFAASCYLRGVAFLQIPTTLLAQVDASIGGKTGVNHVMGKNLIGAFHQPKLCLIDITTLATLSFRQYRAGIAEIIKAALIADADFFSWLETHVTAILQREANSVSEMIYKACRIKAAIVAEDVTEKGPRALLNLGHTFAHAIETALAYQSVLHGEAVAIGCHLAAAYSAEKNLLSKSCVQRIDALLQNFGFDLTLPAACTNEQMMTAMQLDKKNQDNSLRLVLLKRVGQGQLAPGQSTTELLQFLEKNR